MKKKILIFPAVFIIIVVITGFIYSHYNSKANANIETAVRLEDIQTEVLKVRSYLLMFSIVSTEENKQVVLNTIKEMKELVNEAKGHFQSQENKVAADNILSLRLAI